MQTLSGQPKKICFRCNCWPIMWPVGRMHLKMKIPPFFCWGGGGGGENTVHFRGGECFAKLKKKKKNHTQHFFTYVGGPPETDFSFRLASGSPKEPPSPNSGQSRPPPWSKPYNQRFSILHWPYKREHWPHFEDQNHSYDVNQYPQCSDPNVISSI